ncbi:uncharacterized protein LOC122247854 [Penaeus japonicus]|uniref:uncharacterized protein LOC122247854 n=1 Tax=Penaeus japonicus TaxID=27405 RepID=UPI001C70F57D|nr:uncharacterized protein LOC122247854 [Penaeus japonicus]XP_042863436.1 uncharacterized protein LOC122247854 [Penaeus japonicus]
MASGEVFVEVREAAEFEQLAKALHDDLPDCGCVYNIVLMKARLGVHVQSIYVLKRQSDFPVVLFREKDEASRFGVYCRPADAPYLKAALLVTQVISMKDAWAAAIPGHLVSVLKEVLTARCGRPAEVRLTSQFISLDREKALSAPIARCDSGVLCQLGAAGVAHMHSTWKFGNIVPLSTLQALYPAAPSCGLYPDPTSAKPSPPTSKPEEWTLPPGPDDEVPASWVGVSRLGLLGQLMTDSNQRGRGYAGLVLVECTRSMAKAGLLPLSCIEQDNNASMALFEKHGWKKTYLQNWISCEKPPQ